MTAIVRRQGIIERVTSYVRRLWATTDVVASSGAPIPATAGYDPRRAMSALAAFPYVWACVQAISTDLAGVPLAVVRDTPLGPEQVRGSEVEDILRHPHPQIGGVRFRRQLYADFTLTGNAFVWVRETSVGRVLLRLHPAQVDPIADPETGVVTGYARHGQADPVWSADEVLHISDISWEDTIRRVRGESVVRALDDGLRAVQSSRRQAETAARRGRLEMLLRPTGDVPRISPESVKRIVDAYTSATQAGNGVLVLNQALEATPLSFSPRELEFAELNTQVRDEQLAAMGVPPVRAQQPTANYGTAKQQMRMYWERLKHIAALFDESLSRLTGDRSVRVQHDFTDVEALQTSYTERQHRASVWVTAFGVPPKEAAAYEGFVDAPVPADVTPDDVHAPRPPATEVDEPRANSVHAAIERYLQGAAARYQALCMLGEPDSSTRTLELLALSYALREAGEDPARHVDWASGVVDLLHDAVCDHASSADGAIGVGSLRVFGAEHARHLASTLGGTT